MSEDQAVSTCKRTERDFLAFLDRLSPALPESGAIYNRTRQKLIFFFEAYRQAARFAVELADETMDRMASIGSAEKEITNVDAYARSVGRYVLKEFWKKRIAETLVVDVPEPPQLHEELDDRLLFLRRCLDKLQIEDRKLILTYHGGKGREKIAAHRDAATKLNLSPEALRVRAFRIREKLETCVKLAIQESSHSNVSRKTSTSK
jgi:DNA-directed RNA polymerase specialized sigma24 family protein